MINRLELQNAIWRYHRERGDRNPITQIRVGIGLWSELLEFAHPIEVIHPTPPGWILGLRVSGVPCFEDFTLESWDFRPLDFSFEPITVEVRK